VQGFDDTYSAYADHQRRMEYFWCLRWLTQEGKKHVAASVVKDDLVRLDDIPLMLHVPGLGVHARGTKVMLDVMSIDELTVEASCRLLHVIDAPAPSAADTQAEAEEEEIVESDDLSAESEAEAQAEASAESTEASGSADQPSPDTAAPDATDATESTR
jgi:exoribonuclease-2